MKRDGVRAIMDPAQRSGARADDPVTAFAAFPRIVTGPRICGHWAHTLLDPATVCRQAVSRQGMPGTIPTPRDALPVS
jgi:hypothetical protein